MHYKNFLNVHNAGKKSLLISLHRWLFRKNNTIRKQKQAFANYQDHVKIPNEAIVQSYVNDVAHIIDQQPAKKSRQTIRDYSQSLQKGAFKRRNSTALSKFLIFS